jgi:hypothetical protein
MRGLGRRVVEAEQRMCLPRTIEDRGPPSWWTENMCGSETPTVKYIIYNINRTVWNSCRPAKTSQQSCPGVPLPLPRPPPKKTSTFYPKMSDLNFHHQCADPRIDPIGKPPFANPVHRTHAKDSHPKLGSDRVLTSSRTRISSPLAIAPSPQSPCHTVVTTPSSRKDFFEGKNFFSNKPVAGLH